MSDGVCGTLSEGALLDYWLADLAEEEEGRVEEHLLGCEECGRRLQGIIDLAKAIRGLARHGEVRLFVPEAFLARLASDGLRLREYTVPAGGSVACTVTPEDDLVVGRIEASLAGHERVDLLICDASGRTLSRVSDVPVAGSSGAIAWLEPMPALRALIEGVMKVKLLAVDRGGEQLLGEYTFNHKATPPR